MEKFTKKRYERILKIISENKRIENRWFALSKAGFNLDEKAMGSGGVGQIRHMKDEIRVQICYGHGRHNYAYCVIFEK